MPIRLKFHGAARTVTGSCYLLETDDREAAYRLRHVPGLEDRARAELPRLPLRCGGADGDDPHPCPYRSLRPDPQAGQAWLHAEDPLHPCDRRSLRDHAAGFGRHPGNGSEATEPAARQARRGGGRADLHAGRCQQELSRISMASATRPGSNRRPASGRGSGMPAICWVRRRSRSKWRRMARSRCASCSRATSAPTTRCCSPIRKRRPASTMSSANRPMAGATASSVTRMGAATFWPPKSTRRPSARARC